MTTVSPDIIHVVAVLKAKPGAEATLREKALALCVLVQPEPGCIRYSLHYAIERPGELVFYEAWADEAALDAHAKTPHFGAFAAALPDLLAEPITIDRLKKLA
jgi:quinol monooxygenase YgiN